MKHLFLTAIAVVSLSNCATTPTIRFPDAGRYAAEGTKFEGAGTVYVFRGTSRAGAMYPFVIVLDKKPLGSVRRERYLAFPASEGAHQILINCPATCSGPDVNLDIDIQAGKTYYFVVEPDIHFGGQATEFRTYVQQVDEPYALRLLQTYAPGATAK